MKARLNQPSATLAIVLEKDEIDILLREKRLSLDVHRECIAPYVQFVTIIVHKDDEEGSAK